MKDSRLVVARDSESPTTHIDGGISGSCPGDDKFHPGSAISLKAAEFGIGGTIEFVYSASIQVAPWIDSVVFVENDGAIPWSD